MKNRSTQDRPASIEAALARFGLGALRPNQGALVEAAIAGRDAFGLLPTGGGKSLCYQLPSVMLDGTGIVISPLIALMHDQVKHLKARGVRAEALNSLLDDDAREAVAAAARAGDLELLYVSPEVAATPRFRDLASHMRVSLIAVDEAHCISQWGHDFRPEYRRLPDLREVIGARVPWMALTATADPDTRADILQTLALRDPVVVRASGDRPNIALAARARGNDATAIDTIVEVAERFEQGAGIVYTLTRAATMETAEALRERGIPAYAFHAKLSITQKMRVMKAFATRERIVICATIAFGMGIDRGDVRWVIHRDLPKSPEGYAQETGRAGRDGKASFALLLFGAREVTILRKLAQEASDARVRARELARLSAMVDLASDNRTCRRRALLAWFHEPKDPCGICDVCCGSMAKAFEKVAGRAAPNAGPARRSPEPPPATAVGVESETERIYEALRAARKRVAAERRLKLYMIASNKQLGALADHLAGPAARDELPAPLSRLAPLVALVRRAAK